MVELILAYAFISNEPMYLREPGPGYSNMQMTLHVNEELYKNLYVDIAPYVIGRSNEIMTRAGARVAVGYHFPKVDFEVFHHSSHNLDTQGIPLEIDGVQVRIKF